MAAPIPAVSVPSGDDVPEVVKEVLRKEEVHPEPSLAVQQQQQLEFEVDSEPNTSADQVLSVLEDLTPVDRLLITRRLRVKGVLFLRGKKNRFFIRTPDQNLVYTVEEENSWWVGYFCYGLRPLQLRVKNSLGVEVMRIDRPYAFTTRILPCQTQRLQVFSPPGQRIGSVEQQWTAIKPLYLVRNDNGDTVFWIQGPCFTLSCFKDVQFHILRADGTSVGATCKRWEGLVHALFVAPVTDRCGVAFDRGLSVEEKALLLATTLLLDYMYYDI